MAKKQSESLGRQVERKVKELLDKFEDGGVYAISVTIRAAPVGGGPSRQVRV